VGLKFPKIFFFKHLLLFAFISLTCVCLGQTKMNKKAIKASEKYARDLFTFHNFKEALSEYLILYKQDSLNAFYNYRIGICYLNTNIDKTKALSYLEFASKHPKTEVEVWYELGRYYQYVYRFEEAIEAYRTYMKLQKSKKDKFFITPARQIQMCRNAMELIKTPINVTFVNLGEQINSPYPDFSPFITADESYLVFSSKRESNTGKLLDFDGYYTTDIYTSVNKDGNWSKIRNFGNMVNTDLIEEAAGMSADGNTIFVYIDNYQGFNDIIWTQKRGRSFQKGSYISPNINSNKLETSATISPDGETIIFASERDGGYGGTDLYISRRLPNGEWSLAENLGPKINTSFNEDFPNFSPDGKMLYFASQGHKSIGGYDIFRTEWDDINKTWSHPENIGYPINTPDDNMTISFTSCKRYAYMSAFRKNEGSGDLDIYKVIFNDVATPYVVVSGNLLKADSSNYYSSSLPIITKETNSKEHLVPREKSWNGIDNDKSVSIKVYDKETGRLFGRYLPNKITGKYVLLLPPGDYNINIFVKNKMTYKDEINIPLDIQDRHIFKDVVLTSNE